jgi:diguanylate cyclase (GGDEF)-like protein/PAS domain S-box-containing protein
VAAGNFNIAINSKSPDEFGKLAGAFTGMAGNLRSIITSLETQVTRRTERLEALNHELNSEIGERQKIEVTLRESEERFRRTFEDSPLGMAVVGLDFKFVTVNSALCRMLGYSADELTALTFPQITHPEDLDADVKLAQRLMRGEIPNYSIEKRYYKKNGDVLWIRLTVAFVRDENSNPLYFLSMIEDIGERKRAETDLQNANEQLTGGMLELERRNNESALLNAMGELLQSCDDVTEAFYVIRNIAQKLFPNEIGILSVAASSKNFIEVVAQWGDNKTLETVFSPNDCWGLRRGRVHYSEPEDGTPNCQHLSDLPDSVHLCIPLMAHGETIRVFSLCQSETSASNALKIRQRLAQTVADSVGLALANLRLRDTLRNQSIRDGLTGLFNRRYMEETLDREIRRATRSKNSVGVMMIDIDHFKRFNDTFGHAAGDAMLVELGKLFAQNLRGSDIACRYGGEEFTVIMPEAALEATKQKAEAIREEFKRIHLMHEGQSLGPTSLSIGISASPTHGTTGEALLRAADLALYDAKHSGRDRVAIAP